MQQLLTLSRLMPEEGYTPDDVSLINLHRVAVDEITYIAPDALKKNIEIELLCSCQKIMIMGNITALGILLRNLCDNAVRYTPENSTVQVEISQQGKHVILKVTDNGPGIPVELRSRVFERFYRVLGTKQMGTGLGLAIVQQIAELHHAVVSLSSPPNGRGLEVTILFPLPENFFSTEKTLG